MIYIIGILIVMFILGFALSKIFPKICVVCFSVMATWIMILVASGFGFAIDDVILGILMGGSSVGAMYYLSSKLLIKWHVFKFPFILTSFSFTYYLIRMDIEVGELMILLLVWVIFFLLVFIQNERLKVIVKKLTECCRNW